MDLETDEKVGVPSVEGPLDVIEAFVTRTTIPVVSTVNTDICLEGASGTLYKLSLTFPPLDGDGSGYRNQLVVEVETGSVLGALVVVIFWIIT